VTYFVEKISSKKFPIHEEHFSWFFYSEKFFDFLFLDIYKCPKTENQTILCEKGYMRP